MNVHFFVFFLVTTAADHLNLRFSIDDFRLFLIRANLCLRRQVSVKSVVNIIFFLGVLCDLCGKLLLNFTLYFCLFTFAFLLFTFYFLPPAHPTISTFLLSHLPLHLLHPCFANLPHHRADIFCPISPHLPSRPIYPVRHQVAG